MLNVFRYGLFAWQLASHKLCRWLVPVAMLLAFVTNVALVSHPAYAVVFLLQLGFYAAALGGVVTGARSMRIPAFLCVVNAAILVAWCRYARGERMTTWNPSERTRALPQVGAR